MIRNKLLGIGLVFLIFYFLFGVLSVFGTPLENEIDLEYPLQPTELNPGLSMGWLLLRYFLTVLAIIILTVFGARYIAGKFRVQQTGEGDWIQVLDRVMIGTNKGLMLVEIEDKGYVLAISDYSINVISIIDDPDRLDELRGLGVGLPTKKGFDLNFWGKKTTGKDFSQTLDRHLKRSLNLKNRGRDFND